MIAQAEDLKNWAEGHQYDQLQFNKMFRICANCKNPFGYHRTENDQCPIVTYRSIPRGLDDHDFLSDTFRLDHKATAAFFSYLTLIGVRFP
jgi:hypothetical protein